MDITFCLLLTLRDDKVYENVKTFPIVVGLACFLDRQNFDQSCCEDLLWICSVCRCAIHNNWELFSLMSVESQIGDNSTFIVRVY